MSFALQFLIDVLSLGGAYALMALGLVIVYGILRLVNFAYGELIMVAGSSLLLLGDSPLPWIIVAILSVIAASTAWLRLRRTMVNRIEKTPRQAMAIRIPLRPRAMARRSGLN